jgi:hypothetical protein
LIKRDGTRKEEETYDDAFDAVVKVWLQHCLSGHVCVGREQGREVSAV